LTEASQLVRACLDHPNIEPFTITIHDDEEGLPDTVYCSGGNGGCNNSIYPGVFLRHVGCHAHNPYWDGRTVNIPGTDSTTTYQFATPEGQKNILVTHWEIGMMRTIPAAQEMWFPLMLLRATSETLNNQSGKRIGVLVELAGSAQVGKTILAMQSMEYEGYVAEDNGQGRHIEVKDFMFSRLPPGRTAATNPLLANLYLSSLMRLNKKGLHGFAPTLKLPGDVKAAFIQPASSGGRKLPLDSTGSEPRKSRIGAIAKIVIDILIGIKDIFWSHRSSGFWYTVILYDIAGEAFIVGDPTTDAIERAVDKVAVLVDATEIFNFQGDGDSVAMANEQIGKAAARNLPHCLVVTKVDLVMQMLLPEDQVKVKKFAEDLSGEYKEETRELLKKWLSQGTADANIRQLNNRIDKVDRVFLIWTENLPTSNEQGTVQTSSEQPRSYGLARFICWCLEIPWTALNRV